MSSKRNLVAAMGLFLAFLTPFANAQNNAGKSATSDDSNKAPRLTIVEPVKEYGQVAKGDKIDWSFVIKNTGTADLDVIAARPSCGCTVADFDKVIKPGESGKVTAHIDTTAFTGPIAKTITLETNDPTSPTSQLTLQAIVKPFVEAYPAGFVRFNLLQGEQATQSITLYSDEDAPFEITNVQAPSDWIKVSTRKLDDADRIPHMGRAGQNQYRVDITVGGNDATIGPMANRVEIFTNSRHQPMYPVSVTGVIRPTFNIEPTILNFGEVTPTEAAATRSVLLHSNNLKTPEDFVITKVESSTSVVTTAFRPLAQKGDYEVTLQVAHDAKPGDIDGTVTIYTSDKVHPIVTVPVKGTVKG